MTDKARAAAQIFFAVALVFSVAIKHPSMVCALVAALASLGGSLGV